MKKIVFGLIVFVILVLASGSLYIVNEDEVAVVKTFGRVDSVVVNKEDAMMVEENLAKNEKDNITVYNEKGLHFKMPFVQTVEKYTAKYLTYKSATELINTADDRRISIQMYAQYRVLDPAIFNITVGTKSAANNRMDEYIYKTVINSANNLQFDEFFYQNTLEDLLDDKQEALNEQLVSEFGIYVSDIGINRKTFPPSNIAKIEEKMTKEIEKESAEYIAEGDKQYNQKVAQVDALRAQTIADAVEAAAIIKAQADAEAIRTYQAALEVDLDFYRFIQRMEIYKSIKGSTIFLDDSNAIFEFLNGIEGLELPEVAE